MPGTLDDVAAIALALPATAEKIGGHGATRQWTVAGKLFAWERPLTKADVARLGDAPVPDGDLLGLRTEDLHEKEAVLAGSEPAFFTIAHFDNYPAYLVRLKTVRKRALREAIVDAWLAAAPPKLAEEFVAGKGSRSSRSTGT